MIGHLDYKYFMLGNQCLYSSMSRYIGDSQADGGVSSSQVIRHYQLREGHIAYGEESMGSVSRSSTRNHSTHEQADTHSIGPGSMAGGSLFGGYIPAHVEAVEKSAFSEYNLTKNEDGDYVLREVGFFVWNVFGELESNSFVFFALEIDSMRDTVFCLAMTF